MNARELEMAAAPAPWINQYGQAVHTNPWNEYRPNPAYVSWAREHPAASVPTAVATKGARRAIPHRRLQILAVLIVIATLLVGVKAAHGYWTAVGVASGSAQTGTATVSVVASTVPGSPLYPGGSGTVRVSINNPNPFVMQLTAITGAGTVSATPSCSPTGVTFTDQTGLNISLPANTTTVVDRTNAASMSNASANGCQGATFTIPVSISTRQP